MLNQFACFQFLKNFFTVVKISATGKKTAGQTSTRVLATMRMILAAM